MDIEIFRKAFPKAKESVLIEIHKHLPYYMGVYDINTPQRQANFLSQVNHESQGLNRLRENLNYSVEGLLNTFGRHRITTEQAHAYGRTPQQPANQEAIANILYGGEWGTLNLGNNIYGDGWKFIGRGLIHVTGKANYRRFGQFIGDEKLIMDNPEILETPQYACWSACWFWITNGLNQITDDGKIAQSRRIVNGGMLGWDEVLNRYNANLILLS